MNVKELAKTVASTMSDHAPGILTGLGVAGMIASIVLAVKATPEAEKRIYEAEVEKDFNPLTPVETVKAAWKCYIPAGATAAVSAACIFGGQHINSSRGAMFAAAYTLTDRALKESDAKHLEILGAKKEKEIKDSIAQDRVNTEKVHTAPIIQTGNGQTICYESISGRKFYGDIEKIRQKMNDFNYRLRDEGFLSLNEWFDMLDIPFYAPEYDGPISGNAVNDEIGWDINHGYLDLEFSSVLVEGTPCIYIGYRTLPRPYRR